MKFNINSPFFDFVTTCSQFILLNLLFILFCLPVFTIGSALASLYYVTMKESQGEHGYLVRNFIKAFKVNFKRGTAACLVFLGLGGVFAFNIAFWSSFDTLPTLIITIVMIIAAAILYICFLYTFPLLGRYENTLKQTLKNALLIGFQNIKKTVMLIAIHLFILLLCFNISYAAVFFLVLGFSFTAYCTSFLYIKVFKQLNILSN